MDSDTTHIIPKGQNIINFGELGTTFYIILKGKVAVRVPYFIDTQLYTLSELCLFLFEKHPWIVEDENYENVIAALHNFLPEIIKISAKGEYMLNFNELKRKLQK